ncbi:MAG: hypothetical protein KDE14_07380 [Rhodobacteraceae bacterium]|nr:hypothetical protein [Paracoccaceae bacterium]
MTDVTNPAESGSALTLSDAVKLMAERREARAAGNTDGDGNDSNDNDTLQLATVDLGVDPAADTGITDLDRPEIGSTSEPNSDIPSSDSDGITPSIDIDGVTLSADEVKRGYMRQAALTWWRSKRTSSSSRTSANAADLLGDTRVCGAFPSRNSQISSRAARQRA